MIDREKVIKALELEVKYPYTWECASECPYYGKTNYDCYTQVVLDALELLKEQEPVPPIAKKEMDEITSYLETVYYCGNCHAYLPLYKEYNIFCVKCGRKINWNDQ